jgi:hypothetical protein
LLRDQGPADLADIPDREDTTPPPLSQRDLLACADTLSLAAVGPAGFPASLPWLPLYRLSDRLIPRDAYELASGIGVAGMSTGPSWTLLAASLADKGPGMLEDLRYRRPVRFLEMCLERYRREVQGYSCTMLKRERVKGTLNKPEELKIHFREKPFSVFMEWKKGSSLASKVLYVEGENDGKLLARALLLVVSRDVDGSEAKKTSRYLLPDFGMYIGARRSVRSMQRAEERGKLHMHYYGAVPVAQLGGRLCYKFVRGPYDPPDHDGVWEDPMGELTIFIDCETWLQVGSILRDPEGNLIAEYFFRDVHLNPKFDPKQFTRASLNR